MSSFDAGIQKKINCFRTTTLIIQNEEMNNRRNNYYLCHKCYWNPGGTASSSFTLIFSLTTGIMTELLKVTKNKKEKYNKIVMIAKTKLNGIETLMSQAIVDLNISHDKFKSIVNEKEKYEQMKESFRDIKTGMS